MICIVRAAAAAGIAACAFTAQAQVAAPAIVAQEVVQPTGSSATLPSNTEVLLTFDHELNSKQIKQGQSFDVRLSRDIMLGNYIVIPRGTPGHGQLSYRTGKGAFGKSAKMEFDLVALDLNGRTIPLTGHYRIEGNGNTGAAVGAVVAVGVLGAFVTGHSAVVPQGAEYKAFTKEPLLVALAAPAAPMAPAPAVAPPTATTPAPAIAHPAAPAPGL